MGEDRLLNPCLCRLNESCQEYYHPKERVCNKSDQEALRNCILRQQDKYKIIKK